MSDIDKEEYKIWLKNIKSKIYSSQIKAAVTVNSVLIEFYWDLGWMIVQKQKESNWGNKLLDKLSLDLKSEFPEIKGLSKTNLKYCRMFYLFYKTDNLIGQQGVDQLKLVNRIEEKRIIFQIPWSHNIFIFTKSKSLSEAYFYIKETILNNWSRDILALQIKSNLYERQGKAITNFKYTLPKKQSDLAIQTMKDPYIFDFLNLTEPYKEKNIEDQLVSNVTKFLLELGKGFAFIGRQYNIEVAGNDYYIDLLFYHVKLKCYIVVELKNTKFIPEYAGKLNFYLSAVDSYVKDDNDNPTIGILLCRDKNNIEAEFSLRDINKPIGISEFELSEILPNNLKSSLPTIEELEKLKELELKES